MQQCPHCGSRVDGEPSCPNCGQSFEALSERAHAEQADAAETPEEVGVPAEVAGDDEQQSEADDTDSTLLSRRALLGGAGVSVAVLGVGGAGWAVLRGGEGQRVISSYVDAMAANNFPRVPELYHDDAPLLRQIEQSAEFDDYEGYLQQREVLETWRDIEPELKGIEEFYHITEVTEESLSELDLRRATPTAEDIDEFRQVVAFIAVAVGALDEEQQNTGQYYDGGTERLPLTCTVVRVNGNWQLWTARAALVS